MSSAVSVAAYALSLELLRMGRAAEALETATRGLRLDPYAASLQEVAIRATELHSGPEAAERLRLRFSQDVGELDPEWSA